jgi:hypothetical protein
MVDPKEDEMTDDATWLDGNALGGLLHEVFGAELTKARRTCKSCGFERPLGAHRLYRSAGEVLRCPVCGDIALVIASLPDRHIVSLEGGWRMELAREPAAEPA